MAEASLGRRSGYTIKFIYNGERFILRHLVDQEDQIRLVKRRFHISRTAVVTFFAQDNDYDWEIDSSAWEDIVNKEKNGYDTIKILVTQPISPRGMLPPLSTNSRREIDALSSSRVELRDHNVPVLSSAPSTPRLSNSATIRTAGSQVSQSRNPRLSLPNSSFIMRRDHSHDAPGSYEAPPPNSNLMALVPLPGTSNAYPSHGRAKLPDRINTMKIINVSSHPVDEDTAGMYYNDFNDGYNSANAANRAASRTPGLTISESRSSTGDRITNQSTNVLLSSPPTHIPTTHKGKQPIYPRPTMPPPATLHSISKHSDEEVHQSPPGRDNASGSQSTSAPASWRLIGGAEQALDILSRDIAPQQLSDDTRSPKSDLPASSITSGNVTDTSHSTVVLFEYKNFGKMTPYRTGRRNIPKCENCQINPGRDCRAQIGKGLATACCECRDRSKRCSLVDEFRKQRQLQNQRPPKAIRELRKKQLRKMKPRKTLRK